MNPSPANSPFIHFQRVWRRCWRAAPAALAAGLLAGYSASGQVPITVGNYSFETPTTTFVTSLGSPWHELPQPANFNSSQGYTWAQVAGTFLNTATRSSDHITNLDGNQAAYIFNDQGVGIYQQLGSSYTVGTSYQLVVGIVGQGGGIPDGATILVQFYYLDSGNNMVAIASTTATESATNFPNHTQAFDYTANLPAVNPTDPWANQPIGIEIVSPAGPSMYLGGYWDLDNVRVNAFPPVVVPTPGLPGLFVCAGALLSLRGLARGLSRGSA
jgi:hypothetical protein